MLIWDRKEKGRFPEVKEVVGRLDHVDRNYIDATLQQKQLVRDIIAPDMPLGHSDRKKPATTNDDDKKTKQQAQEKSNQENQVCTTCVE